MKYVVEPKLLWPSQLGECNLGINMYKKLNPKAPRKTILEYKRTVWGRIKQLGESAEDEGKKK